MAHASTTSSVCVFTLKLMWTDSFCSQPWLKLKQILNEGNPEMFRDQFVNTIIKNKVAGLKTVLAIAFFAVTLCALLPTTSHAQSFSAVVSPPRFEVAVQPGKTIRQVIEITQASNEKGTYRIYTNDWTIGADGNAVFADDLAPNSCRPWVSLERRELTIAANAKVRFRFEITPPADGAATECRFAIMIEGAEQVVKATGAMSFPVSGRVGVVVYAAVGEASPNLEISQNGTRSVDGMIVPVLNIKNSGNAHGRAMGFLKGTDPEGVKIDFLPEPLPILPGQTRSIALIPQTEGSTLAKFKYPLNLQGAIEWSDSANSKKTQIDFRFDAPASASPTLPAPPAPALKAPPASSGLAPK
jgi:hypothetical protein